MSRSRHKHKAHGGGLAPNIDHGAKEAGGNPDVFAEAKKRKHGGKAMHMHGAKAKHKLNRPGRKSGGRVGADKSPLTGAHHEAGGHRE